MNCGSMHCISGSVQMRATKVKVINASCLVALIFGVIKRYPRLGSFFYCSICVSLHGLYIALIKVNIQYLFAFSAGFCMHMSGPLERQKCLVSGASGAAEKSGKGGGVFLFFLGTAGSLLWETVLQKNSAWKIKKNEFLKKTSVGNLKQNWSRAYCRYEG